MPLQIDGLDYVPNHWTVVAVDIDRQNDERASWRAVAADAAVAFDSARETRRAGCPSMVVHYRCVHLDCLDLALGSSAGLDYLVGVNVVAVQLLPLRQRSVVRKRFSH